MGCDLYTGPIILSALSLSLLYLFRAVSKTLSLDNYLSICGELRVVDLFLAQSQKKVHKVTLFVELIYLAWQSDKVYSITWLLPHLL